MAFCNNDCECGGSCSRQDNHGGDCDCDIHGGTCPLRPKTVKVEFTLHLVRNDKGEYLSERRSARYRDQWTKDFTSVRTFTNPSQALGRITQIAQGGTQVPDLVECKVTQVRVIDQRHRVAQALRKKKRRS